MTDATNAFALTDGRRAFVTVPGGDVIGLKDAVLQLSPADAAKLVPAGHAVRVAAKYRVRVAPGHSIHVPGKPPTKPGDIVEVDASDIEQLQRTGHATIIGPVGDATTAAAPGAAADAPASTSTTAATTEAKA